MCMLVYMYICRCMNVAYFIVPPLGVTKHGLSTAKAYLADITPSKDRASVLGTFNAVSGLGFIIGPLIGGEMANADPTLQFNMLAYRV